MLDRPNSVRNILVSAFWRIQGITLTVISILLAVAAWFWPQDVSISVKIAVPIFLLCLLIMSVSIAGVYDALTVSRLPKVLHGRAPSKPGVGHAICLLGPSELYSHETAVSFFLIDDSNFEQLIGIGSVLNIQENRSIQVVLWHVVDGQDDVVKRLAQNDATVLRQIRVKPSVPRGYLDSISGE